jgi:LPXTG-motif cell wall-anchored protein
MVAACDLTIGDLALGGTTTYTCDSSHTPDTLAWTFTNEAVTTGVGPLGTIVTAEDDARIDPIFVLGTAQGGDTVFLDKNANGIQDPEDPGINGATVILKDADGNVIATQITAKGAWDGFYKFLELDAGTYTFVLDLTSVTGELTTAGSFTVTLVDGDDYLLADFGVAEVLPKTGLDSEGLTLLAVGLLMLGAMAVLSTRKKREEN